MDSIFRALANTTSRIEKECILRQHLTDSTLKRVLFLALDPFTQFYIRKIPNYIPGPASTNRSTMLLEGALDNLEQISKRVVTGNAAINHLKIILESVTADDAYVIERSAVWCI